MSSRLWQNSVADRFALAMRNHLVSYFCRGPAMTSSAIAEYPASEERLDRLFHALSDRTRRAVLNRLAQGPASVSELSEPFEMTRPAVSKHLRVLEEAQLIARTVDGRIHRCSFRPEPLRDTAQWLDSYRGFWDETLTALADYAEDRESHPDQGRR